MGQAAGGRAKIVARQTRKLQGLPEAELVVFTLSMGGESIAKGWTLLVPRNDEMVILGLVTHQDYFNAMRPTMERLLNTLRPYDGASEVI